MRSAFVGLFVCLASALAAKEVESLVWAAADFPKARVEKGVVFVPLEIAWLGENAILLYVPDSGLLSSDTTGYAAPRNGVEPDDHEFFAQHRERSDVRFSRYRVVYPGQRFSLKGAGLTKPDKTIRTQVKLGSLEQLTACRGGRIELRIEMETMRPSDLGGSAESAESDSHELFVTFPADEVLSRVAPLPRDESRGK